LAVKEPIDPWWADFYAHQARIKQYIDYHAGPDPDEATWERVYLEAVKAIPRSL